MEFGDLLRELRTERGLGLKRAAPDLGVTHGYLSKLENNLVRPSEDFVGRAARYFNYDEDVFMLAASRIPPDVLELLRDHPEEALTFLRARFGAQSRARSDAGTAPPVDRG
jgi:transcriptional regulator with XRE-family HTH domain